jgi:hypothetical protein
VLEIGMGDQEGEVGSSPTVDDGGQQGSQMVAASDLSKRAGIVDAVIDGCESFSVLFSEHGPFEKSPHSESQTSIIISSPSTLPSHPLKGPSYMFIVLLRLIGFRLQNGCDFLSKTGSFVVDIGPVLFKLLHAAGSINAILEDGY